MSPSRKCSTCGATELPYKNRRRCRECQRQVTAKWRAENRDRWRAHKRAHYRRHIEARRAQKYEKEFGITMADYDALFRACGGLCAICSRPDTDGRWLAVDHDHGTGAIRGLLCRRCNNGIGQLQDDPVIVASALEYLIAHKGRRAA